MKYTIADKKELYVKDDGKNSILFLNKKNGRQFFLNRTGANILNRCLEFSDTSKILEELKNKYPEVEEDLLQSDLINIVRLLEVYEILDIQDDEKKHKYNSVIAFGDNNYVQGSKFITNHFENSVYGFKPITNKEYYSPVNLRMRTMNNQEYFIGLTNSDGEIQLIAAINPAPTGCLVLNVSALFAVNEMTLDQLSENLNIIFEYACENIFKDSRKIRFSHIRKKASQKPKYYELINKMNFSEECVLENEMVNGDLVMYSKYIDKKIYA